MNCKRWIALLLLVGLCVSLFACKTPAGRDTIQIAVIVKAEDSDFWHRVEDGVRSAATEYNVSVTFEGPNHEENYLEQNRMIREAVDNGVDAIVLSAINYESSGKTVDEAIRKGVQVVTVDSDVNSSLVSMFIGTDNEQAGRSAGMAAAEQAPSNTDIRIGIVNCYENTDNGQRREKGFRDFINTLEHAEIVDSIHVNSNANSATVGAMTLLQQHPEINVLVGFNEWMTLGIGNAIQKMDLKDSVSGIGFDTNEISVGMLETGEMDALVVQNPFAIGYLGVKYAAELVMGGQPDGRELYTDVTVVTKDNLFDEDIQKILFRFE